MILRRNTAVQNQALFKVSSVRNVSLLTQHQKTFPWKTGLKVIKLSSSLTHTSFRTLLLKPVARVSMFFTSCQWLSVWKVSFWKRSTSLCALKGNNHLVDWSLGSLAQASFFKQTQVAKSQNQLKLVTLDKLKSNLN